ncbi:hypothetical protein CYMTET_37069 [Cymbomonas tetramitiformis]|uniref:RING-type domain-containing protein n=1 Tax=Cymbomonas tetramitiformis TaxID=36881 RepID=A0AAE0F6V6_9CHLO|nr:hypothetical protein CYMTET_37069 [Cymbomonas tetramitiformis]|eukprot:gene32286-40881_t
MQAALNECPELLTAIFPGSEMTDSSGTVVELPFDETATVDGSRQYLRSLLRRWTACDQTELHKDVMAMAVDYDKRLRAVMEADGAHCGIDDFTVAREDLVSRDEDAAVHKLLAESRLVRELLEDAKCVVCLDYLTQFEVGCKGGHTLCKTCLEAQCRQRNDHKEVACPICRENVIMEGSSQPSVCRHKSRMFCDVVGHVCPLCTDPKERSLEQLLAHVKHECVSLVKLATRRDLRVMRTDWAQKLTSSVIAPSVRALMKKRTERFNHRVNIIDRWSAKRASSRRSADSPPPKRQLTYTSDTR